MIVTFIYYMNGSNIVAQNNNEQNIYTIEIIDDIVSKRVVGKIEVPIEKGKNNINKREKIEME